MHPIQVLRCCHDALAEREVSDPDQRWLWSIRRKVVTFCLHRLEDQPGVTESTLPLTDVEERAIRQAHPLLQPRVASAMPFIADRDWMAKIRQRVDAYLESVRARRPE